MNRSAASCVPRLMLGVRSVITVVGLGALLGACRVAQGEPAQGGARRSKLVEARAAGRLGPSFDRAGMRAAVETNAPAPETTPLVMPPPALGGVSARPSKPLLWFRYGERIDWSLQVRGAEGGRARLAVGQPAKVGDRYIVAVKGDAATTGIVDSIRHVVEESSSYLDIMTAMPVVSEIRGEHGKDTVSGKVTRKGEGEGGNAADVSTTRSGSTSTQQVTIYPKTHDGLSALALLRSLPSLKEGASRTFLVYTGVKAWRVTGTYSKREVRTTALGEMETYRVDGVAQRSQLDGTLMTDKAPKKFTGWFSADKRRVPVLFESDSDYGTVALVVTAYSDR